MQPIMLFVTCLSSPCPSEPVNHRSATFCFPPVIRPSLCIVYEPSITCRPAVHPSTCLSVPIRGHLSIVRTTPLFSRGLPTT